jgi:hypothetical protein
MSGSANQHPLDRLSEYLDDELEIEERTGIDRHLASCEHCRSSLQGLRRLSRAIAEEAVPPVPVDLAAKIASQLDEATVARPRRWRLALPATIAATLSAIGILVAIQWREGRLTPLRPIEPAREARDAAAQAPAPVSPPPADERPGEVAERKVKDRSDVAGARERDFKTTVLPEAAPSPPAPSPSVSGGLAREEGDVGAVLGNADEMRVAPTAPAPSEKAIDKEQEGRFLQKQSAMPVDSALVPAPAPIPAAKTEAVSTCADRWSDSGARGTWEVPDPVATARELNSIAHDVGGIGLWWGMDDGRPYKLIVPRGRYTEVLKSLRARGIAGLVEPPALTAGDDCTALSITIVRAR